MGLLNDLSKSLPNLPRKLSLKGVAVVITRPEEDTKHYFERLGATVFWGPATQMASRVASQLPALNKALDEVYARDGWLILPSPIAVRHLQEAIELLGRNDGETTTIRGATVGAATAKAMYRAGWVHVFTPPQPTGESLAASLPIDDGTVVLIVGSAFGREELRTGLLARGAKLRAVSLYMPEANPSGLRVAIDALTANPETVVTATSPAGVDAIWLALADAGMSPSHVRWAAIGTTTYADLIARGALAARVAMAPQPDDEGLARAVAAASGKFPAPKNAP